MASMGDIEKSLEKPETIDFETVEMEGLEKDAMSLEFSPGWKAVVKELTKQIESIDNDVFDINNSLTDAQRKEKLIQRYYLVELINLPKAKRELFMLRKGGNTPAEEL